MGRIAYPMKITRALAALLALVPLAIAKGDTVLDFSGDIPAKNTVIENDFPAASPMAPASPEPR